MCAKAVLDVRQRQGCVSQEVVLGAPVELKKTQEAGDNKVTARSLSTHEEPTFSAALC